MHFSRKSLGIPYALFLLVFVVLPLFVLVFFAFTNGQGQFTFSNFTGFFTDPNTLGTLCYSLLLAAVTTIVCLLIAYPTAYILGRSRLKSRSVILMLFIMPMWINFSLRITALKEILTILEGNLAMYPFLNAVIGMTYDFLPFMILPIYTTISRLDGALLYRLRRRLRRRLGDAVHYERRAGAALYQLRQQRTPDDHVAQCDWHHVFDMAGRAPRQDVWRGLLAIVRYELRGNREVLHQRVVADNGPHLPEHNGPLRRPVDALHS